MKRRLEGVTDMNFRAQDFAGKNVLLLQGPIGNFFYRLAKLLKNADARVFKLNFNGGDFLYYPFNATRYKGKMQHFSGFFSKFCKDNKIDTIMLFGDCRPLHERAIKEAKKMGLEVFVFENGYLRPNYITLEKDGVNANSAMSKDEHFYLKYHPKIHEDKTVHFKHSYQIMCVYGFFYWLFAFLLAPFFNNSLHHRSLSPLEILPWVRSYWYKIIYTFTEKKQEEFILNDLKGRYFVAILQVYNDSQILRHYKDKSVMKFIASTIKSFAKYSSKKHFLVFKHHPMDRGYRNYKAVIERLAKKHGVNGRVLYIHDIRLPELFARTLGCVVVNSTLGLSALYHNCALKICGKAFYDIKNLSYQGTLNSFWKQCHNVRPKRILYKNLRGFLVDNNQINATFYRF